MNMQRTTPMFVFQMSASLAVIAFGCANTAENCELIGMCGGKDASSVGGMGGGGMGGAGGMAPDCQESLLTPLAVDRQSAENVHIAPDGSLVMTGNYTGKLLLGPTTMLESAGPNPEFFLVRYGADLTITKAFAMHAFLLDTAMNAAGKWAVVGTHSGAVVFPDGCGTLADTSGLFVAQFDAADKCVWAKSYALGPGTEVAAHVTMGTDGAIALAGGFSGTIAGLAPTGALTSVGTKDVFVAKVDAAGSSLWAGSYGRAGQTQVAQAVALDAAGDVVIAGDYDGTLNFNDAKLGTMQSDHHVGFAAKFAGSGMSVSWQKSFVMDSGTQHITAMALSGNNEVIVAGDINGTSSADKLEETHRLFLAKLGLLDGTMTPVKAYAGSGAPMIHDIAVTPDGRIVLTGHLDDKLDFGDGELGAAMAGERFYWTIVDKDGANSQSRSAGDAPTGEKRGLGIAVDAMHAFVVGHFEGTMSLAGQSRTSGDMDIFAAKLCLP